MIKSESSKPMRVLFLASYFPKPGNPTMGTWALEQAQAFARSGMDVRVISFTPWIPRFLGRSRGARAYSHCPLVHDWNGLQVEYPRWSVYRINPIQRWTYSRPSLELGIGWHIVKGLLSRIVKQWKPDVVYAHHTCCNGYVAWRMHRKFGLPYVITDHEFSEIDSCSNLPARRSVFETVADSAWQMISVARRMEEAEKRLFPRARTRTLYNGTNPVPAEIFETPRPAELADRQVIFSAGMFTERKGFPLLIEAFARIARRHPNAILRIGGEGHDRPIVEETIAKFQMQERVQLLGLLPRQRVMQEMVWSDLFALVGWNEPFATVFLEAMAAGKAVVCANDGGITDVLHNEVHGLTVPPHDVEAASAALDRLLADPELCQRLGRAGRELIETELTWDANARNLKKIFEQALDSQHQQSVA